MSVIVRFHCIQNSKVKNEPSCAVSSSAGSHTHDFTPSLPHLWMSSCGFGKSTHVHESPVATDCVDVVSEELMLTSVDDLPVVSDSGVVFYSPVLLTSSRWYAH